MAVSLPKLPLLVSFGISRQRVLSARRASPSRKALLNSILRRHQLQTESPDFTQTWISFDTFSYPSITIQFRHSDDSFRNSGRTEIGLGTCPSLGKEGPEATNYPRKLSYPD